MLRIRTTVPTMALMTILLLAPCVSAGSLVFEADLDVNSYVPQYELWLNQCANGFSQLDTTGIPAAHLLRPPAVVRKYLLPDRMRAVDN